MGWSDAKDGLSKADVERLLSDPSADTRADTADKVAALFARGSVRADADQIIVRNDFGADEAAFNVCVNCAGGLWGACAARNCPRAHLFLARREE